MMKSIVIIYIVNYLTNIIPDSMLPNNTISAVIVLNKNNFGSVGYSAIRIISIKTKKNHKFTTLFSRQ